MSPRAANIVISQANMMYAIAAVTLALHADTSLATLIVCWVLTTLALGITIVTFRDTRRLQRLASRDCPDQFHGSL
jgi:hypothetical protein